MTREATRGRRIGIPGMMTCAYLALRLFQPDFIPVPVPFDQIDQAINRGDVDAGLLIHEGQLTYKDDGLHLIADMGAWWLEKTGLPLPLADPMASALTRRLHPFPPPSFPVATLCCLSPTTPDPTLPAARP